jgi:hypothetical protein
MKDEKSRDNKFSVFFVFLGNLVIKLFLKNQKTEKPWIPIFKSFLQY